MLGFSVLKILFYGSNFELEIVEFSGRVAFHELVMDLVHVNHLKISGCIFHIVELLFEQPDFSF